MAQSPVTVGVYPAKYTGVSGGGGICSTQYEPHEDAYDGYNVSIEKNLTKFKDDIVNRIESTSTLIADAIQTLSTIIINSDVTQTNELIKAQEAAVTFEQKMMVEQKTLEAAQAMTPSVPELEIAQGLSMYRPELSMGARQAEMKRYIAELNNVPLNNSLINTDTGTPLPGYVDTSQGSITAMGQEFRNFVRFFCDLRSVNGKLASTRFLEYNSANKTVSQYWCGQNRGIGGPSVQQGRNGRYTPLEGSALLGYINTEKAKESMEAQHGRGKAYLINAAQNVADLYFEPHTLNKDADIYTMAEQQLARFVVGRASDLQNTADFSSGEGQRAFLAQQGRVARLGLSRYVFADMFSKKLPTMPPGSATWAAKLIEENIGNCDSPDPSYADLCALTKQLRKKNMISESEFFDVIFSRQFQGMAFSNKIVKMTGGQLKRMQLTLQSLQLALNYERNRLKEQQLALMAAIYAQQNQ